MEVFYQDHFLEGYEKISEQCPMTLSQLTIIDKLEVAVIYADDGISGTNTKKREDFNSFVYKLSEKEQQKKL